MNKCTYILHIILILFIANNALANDPKKHIKNKITINNNANNLIEIWDSVNNNNSYIKDPYSITKWEQLLKFEYENALHRKDLDLAFKLSIPLSFTYHGETKFSKGIPMLESILFKKELISQNTLKEVLIKLEEEYRGSNNMGKAILIRKERISNHFINNYWEIYKDCGLFEAAKKDLLQFEKIPPANSVQRLQYYFLLGDLYKEMKEFDSAKYIYNNGLQESKNILKGEKGKAYDNENIVYWKGCFMGMIAECNMENGNYINAIPNLLFDINHSYDNIDNKIFKMIILSKCFIHFKDYASSKIYLDSAEFLLTDKISKPIKLSYLLTRSSLYAATKIFDSSLIYYKSYNNYRDTLYKNIQQNQSILLLVQMEISNRRTELLESKQSLIDSNKQNNQQKTWLLILLFFLIISITLSGVIYLNNIAKSKSKNKIEAQNILINAHSEKIEAQFNHNEILLKEVHHRVKNNLQVMYSLLNLQKRRNKDMDTIETLSSIQNRIQTMALVHQNLYNSGDFEMVELLNYIKTLAQHLASIYKIDKQKIIVELAINENIKLPIETVVAIGLIINEAVSNSFKNAFRNKKVGKLLIKIINESSLIEVTIQDDGDGIKTNDVKENSLGMKLIHLMCLQLKATHTIEKDNGVCHYITFNKV